MNSNCPFFQLIIFKIMLLVRQFWFQFKFVHCCKTNQTFERISRKVEKIKKKLFQWNWVFLQINSIMGCCLSNDNPNKYIGMYSILKYRIYFIGLLIQFQSIIFKYFNLQSLHSWEIFVSNFQVMSVVPWRELKSEMKQISKGFKYYYLFICYINL